jgi:hypothetical protein
MFESLLSRVPVSERDALATSLREMTVARDEMARRNASAVEEGAALALKLADLQARYDNLAAEYEADIRKWNAEAVEHKKLEIAIGTLAEQLESANDTIAELQRQRPQTSMRLVPSEQSNAAGETETSPESSDDEVLVDPHSVEMVCRLVGLFFEGRTHWVLSLGDHTFKVPIHDEAFLEEVRSHQRTFGAGDVIRARFNETTFRRRRDNEPYVKRTLEEVIEVIPPAPSTTQPMFADAPGAAERS